MTQYHYERHSTAVEPTQTTRDRELEHMQDLMSRMRQDIQDQQNLIQRLQRDLRQLRTRLDQHASFLNRGNLG